MPPIYSIESWLSLYLSLGNPSWSVYLGTARECYEAYVLVRLWRHVMAMGRRKDAPPPPRRLQYEFYVLMLEYLGGKERLGARLAERPEGGAKHFFPFCCLRDWRFGNRFVHR